MASQPRERRLSTSAPITDLKGPVGPDFTRPKHKRAVTGFGAQEIKSVEASIPESQRDAYVLTDWRDISPLLTPCTILVGGSM